MPQLTSMRSHLHFAVRIHPDFVRFLLDRGATVRMKDKRGHTPLHSATQSVVFCPETFRILLENGASIDERDVDGLTPLHHAGIGFKDSSFHFLFGSGSRDQDQERDQKLKQPPKVFFIIDY